MIIFLKLLLALPGDSVEMFWSQITFHVVVARWATEGEEKIFLGVDHVKHIFKLEETLIIRTKDGVFAGVCVNHTLRTWGDKKAQWIISNLAITLKTCSNSNKLFFPWPSPLDLWLRKMSLLGDVPTTYKRSVKTSKFRSWTRCNFSP